jgi:GMP synthase (glutamine-hydrolysing)
MPETFEAFVGHKEALRDVPPTAVLLASSPTCRVQMFRVRTNLYATQFHPELDVEGIVTRVTIYREAGYFPPETLDEIIASVRGAVVTEPPRILAAFVARYG